VYVGDFLGGSGPQADLGVAMHRRALAGESFAYVQPVGELVFDIILGPLRDADEAIVGVIGVAYDATARNQADEARREAERKLAEINVELEQRVKERTRDLTAANAELEDFVHSIAHDLRSPLRALSGFSDIVQADYDDVIDDTGRDYLRRIHDAAHHLGDLMDALLSLSKVSRRELVVREVDLSALADEAAQRLSEAHPERIVELEIKNGLVAHGDPALCEIIVQNLFDNAWKFSADKTPARISFRTDCIDGRRAYCVCDNGVGFDPAYTEKLFKPFERLHTTAQFPGTGIGLATVRRAVTRLGGSCWAEGALGEGAQLWFTLGESC
jgi:signal transduction histidine kinase